MEDEQNITDQTFWQEQTEALQGLSDLMSRLNDGLPGQQPGQGFIQDQDAYGDEGEAEVTSEISAALSEIQAQIAQLQAQMAATDVSAELSDHIANLAGIQSELQALLNAVGTHATVASVKARLDGLKQSAEGAISSADGASESFVSEFKGEVSYEKYVEAVDYWRKTNDTLQLANYYVHELGNRYSEDVIRNTVSVYADYQPSLYEKPKEHVDAVVEGMSKAVTSDPALKKAQEKVASITESEKEDIFAISKDGIESYRALIASLPDGAQKEKLQEFISQATRVERDGKKVILLTPDQAELMQKMHEQLERGEDIQASISDLGIMTKEAAEMRDKSYKAAFDVLSEEHQKQIMDFMEQKGIGFDPENPNWQDVDFAVKSMNPENGTGAAILGDIAQGVIVTQTMAKSIEQLRAKGKEVDLAAMKNLALSEKLEKFGMQIDLESLSKEDKEKLDMHVDGILDYAVENPEHFNEMLKNPDETLNVMLQANGLNAIDELTPENMKKLKETYDVNLEARRQARILAEKEHEDVPDMALREELIRRTQNELYDETRNNLIKNIMEEDKDKADRIMSVSYNPETGNYEDKEAQQSVSKEEKEKREQEARDAGLAVVDERGVATTANATIKSDAVDEHNAEVKKSPTELLKGLSSSGSQMSKPVVSLQSEYVATSTASPTQGLPANSNDPGTAKSNAQFDKLVAGDPKIANAVHAAQQAVNGNTPPKDEPFDLGTIALDGKGGAEEAKVSGGEDVGSEEKTAAATPSTEDSDKKKDKAASV